MDYDVYSKYPLRMPNRNKTIEVYKMLGHKFPTVSDFLLVNNYFCVTIFVNNCMKFITWLDISLTL